MRIISFDIDGVLNSRQYDDSKGTDEGNIDVSRLLLLKQLVDHTEAKIALTGSWRRHWDPTGECTDEIGKELEETFSRFGIYLHDKTPEINNDRSSEIKAWLETIRELMIS